jgi:hypothetical protein
MGQELERTRSRSRRSDSCSGDDVADSSLMIPPETGIPGALYGRSGHAPWVVARSFSGRVKPNVGGTVRAGGRDPCVPVGGLVRPGWVGHSTHRVAPQETRPSSRRLAVRQTAQGTQGADRCRSGDFV